MTQAETVGIFQMNESSVTETSTQTRHRPLMKRTLSCCFAAFASLSPLHLVVAQKSRPVCETWVSIPGASDVSDSSYNRCALERAPTLLPRSAMPSLPLEDTEVSGTFTVIVNPDGTVDPRLTRTWQITPDTAFFRRAMETIRQRHFAPGIRRGAAVRSGFILEIQSTTREDTLPATLNWTYQQGLNLDSLKGIWIATAAVAPFNSAQTDSVYTALIRTLIRKQLVKTGSLQPYCIVLENGDSVSHARLSQLLQLIINLPNGIDPGGPPLAAYGCERSVLSRRIMLPRVYRTENGRAVLFPSGDLLPNWPPDKKGKVSNAWVGRCVAAVPTRESVWMDCDTGEVW